MTTPDRDRFNIGKEELAGYIFAVLYPILALVFGEPKLALVIFGLFLLVIIASWAGSEWPLAIFIRTVHIIFIGLMILIKMSIINL